MFRCCCCRAENTFVKHHRCRHQFGVIIIYLPELCLIYTCLFVLCQSSRPRNTFIMPSDYLIYSILLYSHKFYTFSSSDSANAMFFETIFSLAFQYYRLLFGELSIKCCDSTTDKFYRKSFKNFLFIHR